MRAALVCGRPARVLLNQCADADLLVLGGHHADSPLRQTVGAIAAVCLRQAPCPVVIVTAAAAWPGRVVAPAAAVYVGRARAAGGEGSGVIAARAAAGYRADDR